MKNKICLLVVIAVSSAWNKIQKDAENKLEYKNLSIQIERMRNIKCFVTLIDIGATGIVTKRLKIYLKAIQI
jgi:hypothetical protein